MNEPVYRIIENDIKEKLKSGTLKEGDMIPSENELKDMYNVSRMTVRQALNNLVNEGYLYRHKGKGTFVNLTKIEKRIQGLLSFSEEMKRMNRMVKNKIISVETLEADDEVSAKLLLNKGELVYLVNRVRYADDIPVLFEQLYVPKNIVKELNEEIMSGSFYHYIERELKLKISYSIQNIEAKIATNKVTGYLEVTNGSPILFITLNSFLDNNRPFEYVKSYYRADQYRFVQHALR
jgi:GntR family transcriptional regulator